MLNEFMTTNKINESRLSRHCSLHFFKILLIYLFISCICNWLYRR